MLVILYGVSCVGKTTLMRSLEKEFNWKIVTTYMTRKQREGEYEKKQISLSRLIELEEQKFFLCVNHLASASYGTPLGEIQDAIFQKDVFCLDFPIHKKEIFDQLPYTGIVIMPENIEQLLFQIQASGRNNRKKSILQDFQNNYIKDNLEFRIFINKKNEIRNTCLEIIDYIYSVGE